MSPHSQAFCLAMHSGCLSIKGDALHPAQPHCLHFAETTKRRKCYRTRVQALLPAAEVSASAPALQEIIMGSGVFTMVGCALYNGFKGGPEVCDSCQGNGGVKCFGCDATGRMEAIVLDGKPQRRDFVGRSVDPRTCRVCKGTCAILCKKCSGTGFTSTF